ncbi:MAG: heme ABC exporter ATP-binding protein CcmA [Xanthomonadales bacterium]|nr:heme ABC exporter ATP-binding protein CcmA [Gammaproteobacteria bacterium]MBT8053728.1 heme ABC exporter ATP-binding protein CcmA [Gammaproteobacteria bacterium]NND56741.1 heme ABC exporter ATP-binding protein CcmA [Xanthomonadales bacterium]NNK50963.1 heme ABC exporter ATP-binding protein CcmA [Xanthomonadales bacterium]
MLVASQLVFERYFEPVFLPVDFQLENGELLLVTGANGCGKTTLIRVLAGILHPTSGAIDNRFGAMAYVGHYLGIKDDLSVQENLRFMRDFLGLSSRSCTDVIEQVGLTRVAEQQARTLSAGQRKRCALARLLVSESPLWLLDEPYSNLDVEGVELVDDILRGHLETGGACVLATHGAHRPDWDQTNNFHLISGAAA